MRAILVVGAVLVLTMGNAALASAYHRGAATYVGIVEVAPQPGVTNGSITMTVSADRANLTSLQASGTGGRLNSRTRTFCSFDVPALPTTPITGPIKDHEFIGSTVNAGAQIDGTFYPGNSVSVSGKFDGKTVKGEIVAGDPNCSGGIVPITPIATFEATTTASGKKTPECKLAKKRLKRKQPKLRQQARQGSGNAKVKLFELKDEVDRAC